MARVRGRAAATTTTDVQLDTNEEHPALTHVMRRVAGEYWEIVRAKAAEQGLPVVKVLLRPYVDVEDTHVVFLGVHLDASQEQASAFHHSLNPDRADWYAQLDAEGQEASMRLALVAVGLRSPWKSTDGA